MSKTKDLKKGKYTPGNATPAPAKKAENVANATSNNHYERDKSKAYALRSRTRRIASMKKLGVSDEEIEKIINEMKSRLVLCLYYSSFTIQNGMKKKNKKKDEEVPNILHGQRAAEKFLADNKIEALRIGSTYCWIKTDEEHVDSVVETLKPLGRTSVTKIEPKAPQKERTKKSSNNTEEAKKKAKAARKSTKINAAEMRPYYAAWRKGGVSARIKKYNKTLADKIEKWIEERKKALAAKKDAIDKHKQDHRQMSSMEMKANKRARKAAKHAAAQERRREREKKRMEYNAIQKEKRAQNARKPVQTEIKIAALV